MNLSRRAKLDREMDARGGRGKAPPAAAEPAPGGTPDPTPEPVAPASSESPPPVPPPAAGRPKQPRFVRLAAERRAATIPAPLPPPSTRPAGKMMSRNVPVTPKGTIAGAKGPQAARGPVANTKKVADRRRK